MDNVVVMEILKPDDKIGHKKFGLNFRKATFFADMIPQITTIKIIHNQKQILPILKREADIYQEGMPQLSQKFSLVHDWVNRLFLDDLRLVHFLHRVHNIVLLVLHLPYFSEAALSYRIEDLKAVFRNLLHCFYCLFCGFSLLYVECSLEF